MADSTLFAIHGASTHLHEHSQNCLDAGGARAKAKSKSKTKARAAAKRFAIFDVAFSGIYFLLFANTG